MSPPSRHPTQPGMPVTVEGLSYRLDGLDTRTENQSKVFRTLGPKIDHIEKQLVEVRGLDGRGGHLNWLYQEQQRSAQAQGVRIGQLETELVQARAETRQVREQQIDMKARWASAIAAITALVSLLTQLLKGG